MMGLNGWLKSIFIHKIWMVFLCSRYFLPGCRPPFFLYKSKYFVSSDRYKKGMEIAWFNASCTNQCAGFRYVRMKP